MDIHFDLIYGHKRMQSLMRALDLTDKDKKLFGSCYTLTFDAKEKLLKEEIEEVIEAVKESLIGAGAEIAFIGFRSLTIEAVYIRENIQTISNGEKWGLFKDVLEQLGYTVTTSSNMCVTSARFSKQPDFHM